MSIDAEEKTWYGAILGNLFFICILFSAIIPMQLVMQQADNIKEQKIHESDNLDLMRKNEQMRARPSESSFTLGGCSSMGGCVSATGGYISSIGDCVSSLGELWRAVLPTLVC